ncbi:MAG: D-aminoacyl-tRNA deacylase [Desulfobulbaceae bacterium]|nr:D-aminoacyl-tRNA deacylase [Desulfobulbaceae bacterium]
MRAVVQLVKKASVTVDGTVTGTIGKGILLLLGVHRDDSRADISFLADKIVNLRIFPDGAGKMNLSVLDVRGEILVVSQFTLYGDCRKGRRPSYSEAAPPAMAEEFYQAFITELQRLKVEVATGRFQAMMEVALVNDGPVTLLLDSKKRS